MEEGTTEGLVKEATAKLAKSPSYDNAGGLKIHCGALSVVDQGGFRLIEDQAEGGGMKDKGNITGLEAELEGWGTDVERHHSLWRLRRNQWDRGRSRRE